MNTKIPNETIMDERLSLTVKGVLFAGLSYSGGEPITVELLQGKGRDGANTIIEALSELEKYGYAASSEDTVRGGHLGITWQFREVSNG